MTVRTGTHGILAPRAAAGNYTLARHAPDARLAPFVEAFWTIGWDLTGRPAFTQEVLPWPCAHVVIGRHRPGVFGPSTRRFVASLSGAGWVVGAKFRAGGFRPLLGEPMTRLVDRTISVPAFFGARGAALVAAADAAADPDARRAALAALLAEVLPAAPPPESVLASELVELARTERLTRVAELATRAGLAPRALQRLFQEHVGLGPKWVLRRFRIHNAAERLAHAPGPVDAAGLALDAGYWDQAHFIRDFKEQVGKTPGAYRAACAAKRAEIAGNRGGLSISLEDR